MSRIALFGLGISAKSPVVTAKLMQNFYAEQRPQGEKAQLVAYGTPGLELFMDFGETPCRGGLEFEKNTVAYVVHRNTLWEVNNAGLKTSRGTLTTSSGRVSMAHNGVQVMIVDGSKGYIYNTDTLVFSQIVAPGFPANPTTVTYLSQRFIVSVLNSSRFYVSEIDDGLTWDALFFANAESNPDPIVAVWSSNGQLILEGSRTTEFWGNSGTLDFPFAALQGTANEWGLAAVSSIAKYDNTFAALVKSRMGQVMVAQMNGYLPKKISTVDLDHIINGYFANQDAIAYSYMLGGHPMYVINFPSAEVSAVQQNVVSEAPFVEGVSDDFITPIVHGTPPSGSADYYHLGPMGSQQPNVLGNIHSGGFWAEHAQPATGAPGEVLDGGGHSRHLLLIDPQTATVLADYHRNNVIFPATVNNVGMFPSGLDPDGSAYLEDTGTGNLFKCKPDGSQPTYFQINGTASSLNAGLQFDSDGNMWAYNGGASKPAKVLPNYTTHTATFTTASCAAHYIEQFANDAGRIPGRIYGTDGGGSGSIRYIDTVTMLGVEVISSILPTNHFIIGLDQNIYLTETSSGTATVVKKYDKDGTLLGSLSIADVTQLIVGFYDSSGFIWVTSFSASTNIYKVDPVTMTLILTVPATVDGISYKYVVAEYSPGIPVINADNAYGYINKPSPPTPVPTSVADGQSGGQTWLYDGSTQMWSKLKSLGITRHRAQFSFQLSGRTIVADYANGKLYRLTDTALTDNGDSIEGEIIGETVSTADTTFIDVARMRVDMETGVGISVGQGSNPQIALSISRNNGKTYGPEMWKPVGAVGEYQTRVEWRRLGTTRSFTPKLRITDPVKRAIVSACLNPED